MRLVSGLNEMAYGARSSYTHNAKALLTGLGNQDGINIYAYVRNNGENMLDPLGIAPPASQGSGPRRFGCHNKLPCNVPELMVQLVSHAVSE